MSKVTASSFSEKTIETPFGGHKVLLAAFPPAEMSLQSRAVMLSHMSFDPSKLQGKDKKQLEDMKGNNEKAKEFVEFDRIPASAMAEIKDIAIKHMVLSVDGSPDNVLERVKKMHITDYNFIVEQIDEIDKATSLSEDEKKD